MRIITIHTYIHTYIFTRLFYCFVIVWLVSALRGICSSFADVVVEFSMLSCSAPLSVSMSMLCRIWIFIILFCHRCHCYVVAAAIAATVAIVLLVLVRPLFWNRVILGTGPLKVIRIMDHREKTLMPRITAIVSAASCVSKIAMYRKQRLFWSLKLWLANHLIAWMMLVVHHVLNWWHARLRYDVSNTWQHCQIPWHPFVFLTFLFVTIFVKSRVLPPVAFPPQKRRRCTGIVQQ